MPEEKPLFPIILLKR